MDYEEILGLIQQAAGGLSQQEAERAAQATLQTLAERLPRGEARHVLQELPAEMKPWIYTEHDAEPLDIDQFLARVARREGLGTDGTGSDSTGSDSTGIDSTGIDSTGIDRALRDARAVFFALGRALSPEAVAHVAAALPLTFDPLLAEAQNRILEIMPADQFWDRVGQRLGLDRAAARRVAEAVLETLAERIAAGEVEDLIAQLDPRLHPPLRRGMAAAGARPRRMPLEEFLRRVAIRDGAGDDEETLFEQVFDQVRAVFATLAEAVTSKEWYDIVVELPEDYHGLIPARS